jgi:2-methylisocitrate lyase-like PEP mutase family enzyme
MIEAVAAHDALAAKVAEAAGFDAILVGGGLTANFQFGLPDIGVVATSELIAVGDRIARATSLPVLIDIDNGGPSPAHVARAIHLAERSEVAGVMIEDVDSTQTKLVRARPEGGWDFTANRLYPTDVAVERIRSASGERVSAEDLIVIARTDALHIGTHDDTTSAIERARRFVDAGADVVLIAGATPPLLTPELIASVGGPLMYAQAEHISHEERAQLEGSGCKVLFHWLIPFVAAFSAYRDALYGLRDGRMTPYAERPWELNSELLQMLRVDRWVDLVGRAAAADE